MSQAFRCDGLDTPQAYTLNEKDSQKIGPWKFRDWAQITLFGSLGTLKGPHIRSKSVVTICFTSAGPLGAVGTKSAPPGPSEYLRPPKRVFRSQNESF